ncbi:hypothetical protein I7I48_01152 [Histoplasma ohiense]|nr:hypothetical protein I7I48_01152 [Histoplasma ohiense (nom. inval.)]
MESSLKRTMKRGLWIPALPVPDLGHTGIHSHTTAHSVQSTDSILGGERIQQRSKHRLSLELDERRSRAELWDMIAQNSNMHGMNSERSSMPLP